MHGTHQIGIKIHVEVGTTMEKGCRVKRGPLGAIDSFEGSIDAFPWGAGHGTLRDTRK